MGRDVKYHGLPCCRVVGPTDFEWLMGKLADRSDAFKINKKSNQADLAIFLVDSNGETELTLTLIRSHCLIVLIVMKTTRFILIQ